MKTKFLLPGLLSFCNVYAGTSARYDTIILYAIALLILGGLIGTPYLIKFIKNKIKAANQQKEGNNFEDSGNPAEVGND